MQYMIPVIVVLQLLNLCTVCVSIYINTDLRHRLHELEKKLEEMEKDLDAAGI